MFTVGVIGPAAPVAYAASVFVLMITPGPDMLKPEMAIFALAFLPRFVAPSRGRVIARFAPFGAHFLAFEIVVDGTAGLAAGGLGSWPAAHRGTLREFDVATGSTCLGPAAKIAATR